MNRTISCRREFSSRRKKDASLHAGKEQIDLFVRQRAVLDKRTYLQGAGWNISSVGAGEKLALTFM